MAAIPLAIEVKMGSPISDGTYFGIEVLTNVVSDSNVTVDLSGFTYKEQVANGLPAPTGSPATWPPSQVGGYNPAILSNWPDRHRTEVSLVLDQGNQPGILVKTQRFVFEDLRTGVADVPIVESGYEIKRVLDFGPSGGFQLTTSKVPKAVTFMNSQGVVLTANPGRQTAGTGPMEATQP